MDPAEADTHSYSLLSAKFQTVVRFKDSEKISESSSRLRYPFRDLPSIAEVVLLTVGLFRSEGLS